MANPILALRDYVKQSAAELQKVTWPSREMTIRFSVLVIIVSTAFAGFFAALDFGLRQVVDTVFVASAPQQAPVPEVVPDLQDAEGNPIDVNVEGSDEPQNFQVDGVEADATGEITLPPLELE